MMGHAVEKKSMPGSNSGNRVKKDKEKTFRDFAKRASGWDLEQAYEQRPRKKRKQEKLNTRLPIKTQDGEIRPSLLQDVAEDEEKDSGEGSDEEQEEHIEVEVGPKQADISTVPLKRQIIEGKEELAKIAALINEDPEGNAACFRTLSQFAEGKHATIKKLVIGTQLAVYKDVIPGYRIRPLSEADQQIKVSKEVRQQRGYEQMLVAGYQAYIQELGHLAKLRKRGSSEDDRSLSSFAISCACSLLLAVPHFNFRGELIKILVQVLSSGMIDADFHRCRTTLESLFESDEDGQPSLDAVTLLTKMMRTREYRVDESILNIFLHLRLLSEFSFKGSNTKIDKPNRKSVEEKRVQRRKEKQFFLTKKQRRLEKERKVVEKEMREANAVVNHEEQDRLQAETLKMVFVMYFRILKTRSPQLMGGTLEGLAKYAHLINQDFFGDLLEVLKELIRERSMSMNTVIDTDNDDHEEDDVTEDQKRKNLREILLCITTAFTLLHSQETRSAVQTLHLDLHFFIQQTYQLLYPLSMEVDIERSAYLPDPGSSKSNSDNNDKNKINVQTTTVLLLKSLSHILLPVQNARSIPPVRLASFTKQILTSTLNLPEKSSLAILGLMQRVMKLHGKKVAGLWRTEEKRGDGLFDALGNNPDGANPFAATVWEGEILRKHFSPRVREGVMLLEESLGNI
ncbi:MAG: hypothetical protein M1823_003501 [Watsoniomyces obsoletus]|nr:MAG: hypothetical protein M1823_003501 [Watsoniomyces obsoletus]